MEMKIVLSILLTTTTLIGLKAQSFEDENLIHLYQPTSEVQFNYCLVREKDSLSIYYTLKTAISESLQLAWEARGSYAEKTGKQLSVDSIQLSANGTISGQYKVGLQADPWLLVLNIRQSTTGRSWPYPMLIEKNYPVNGFIEKNNEKILEPYLKPNTSYRFEFPGESSDLFFSYYARDFSSPFPPFSINTGTVDPVLIPDSTFTLENRSEMSFDKEGLYLVQTDTISVQGISFRVESQSFPKYTTIQDLIGPLVYISTQDEFKALQGAQGDKLKFDQIILGITKDKDRARRFMKSYFSQVEMANRLFTSYKEGWKTDQGMIYILFGLPDEIRQTDQNQLWYYKNSRTKFSFVKRGSIYDPHYYSLFRDEQYSELWYNTVDLWRKGRF